MINENRCKKYEKTFKAQIHSSHVLKLNLYNIIGFQHDRNLFLSSKHNDSIYGDIYYQYIDTIMFSSMTALGHNLAKILQMITNIEPDLYFTMIYPSANFQ